MIATLVRLLPAACAISVQGYSPPQQIRLRPGFPDDELPISIAMVSELKNPLGISHRNNLVVAEEARTGRRVGWAQIRPLGYAGTSPADDDLFEDVDGRARSRGDVQSARSVEEDVDELLWQDFEDDSTEFPNGLASLPWTREYRAASRAAEDRQRRRERMLELELAARPRAWELSTVYVVPGWRNRGVGSSLVDHIIRRQTKMGLKGKDLYALTLGKNLPWYERFGFVEEERVPDAMVGGRMMGRMITGVLGEQLVCVRVTLQESDVHGKLTAVAS